MGAPRARPAIVRKKRKAVEEESGGENEEERSAKVFTFVLCRCSPLLICGVFYRE